MANTGQGPSDRGGLLEVESDQERAKRIGTFSFVLNAVNRGPVHDCRPLPHTSGGVGMLFCVCGQSKTHHAIMEWVQPLGLLLGAAWLGRAVNDRGTGHPSPKSEKKVVSATRKLAGKALLLLFFANPPSHAYYD